MIMLASQITSLTVVYSTVYSDVNQRKHQSSASLAFVWEIHRGPVNFPHKGPVTRKMFPFDDVIMEIIDIWYAVSAFICLTRMLLSTNFRFEKNGFDKLLCSSFISNLHTKLSMISRSVTGFATDFPCDVSGSG